MKNFYKRRMKVIEFFYPDEFKPPITIPGYNSIGAGRDDPNGLKNFNQHPPNVLETA